MSINIKSTVYRNETLDVTDLNGEKVMMNLEKGKYFALNLVGSIIWEMLEEPLNVENIIHNILEEYDLAYEQCKDDVIRFLNNMLKSDVIRVA